MANYNRSTWTAILFAALLAPFILFLIISLRTQVETQGGGAAASQATTEASTSATRLIPPPASAPATNAPNGTEAPELLAAGDAKNIWVICPLVVDNSPAYRLLQRSSNSGVWSLCQIDGVSYARGSAQGLAASTLDNASSPPAAYVLAPGAFTRFTLDSHDPRACLPRDHTLLATAASSQQIFTVTLGAQPWDAKKPGDRLMPEPMKMRSPSTTLPGVENPFDNPYTLSTRPATAAATAPSAATQPVPGPVLVNAYAYCAGHWTVLPPLGAPSKISTDEVPGDRAFVAAGVVGGRLIVMWVDPAAASTLVARSLDVTKPNAEWSKGVMSRLEEPLPPSTRLMTALLDQTLYVVWPVISPQEVVLRGGWMMTEPTSAADLTLPPRNFLPPLSLGQPAPDESPANIVVGPAENSLAVISTSKDHALMCQIFDQRGRAVTQPTLVEARTPQHQVEIVQNIAMVIMILVLFLSLWQWRQQPMTPKLPSDLEVAPLHMRAFGFGIDLGIPLIVVSAVMGMFDTGAFTGMFATWFAALASPEELLNAPLLMYVLGAYLLHVTIGELFFRRSIGKAILGMQVLMIDGRSPTVAAVLLRNLVRVPELLSGILIIYIFMSQQRQRLGDLFARTLVVSQKAPPTPPDPDANEQENEARKKDDRETTVPRNER
ncbi:MAG TPA: RDD family protein [Phycisphaerae bacterium]|nr:RDD family protein [Phycisphaerae bacterium]